MVAHDRMCDEARWRHGDVPCSSGPGRSFDIQLIRDRNRDSSENASRFEMGGGHVCEANTSPACMREQMHRRNEDAQVTSFINILSRKFE